MWTSLFLTAVTFALVQGECLTYLKDYYEELGCKPEATDAAGCPISYDCSSLNERKTDKCYYQGKEFAQGHKLESTPATACLAECRCLGNDRMAFNCASVECPELFNGPPPPGCHRTYEHGKCCHIEEVCGEEKTAQAKCEYKGEVLKKGQKFYPDEQPCLQCICQDGYNGSFVEPFCHKVSCNLELVNGDQISEGCVPVYYGENGCCPIDWRCPKKSDSVMATGEADAKNVAATDKTCKFGDLTLKVGERLSPSSERGDNMDCFCKVPPHPVCVQRETS